MAHLTVAAQKGKGKWIWIWWGGREQDEASRIVAVLCALVDQMSSWDGREVGEEGGVGSTLQS